MFLFNLIISYYVNLLIFIWLPFMNQCKYDWPFAVDEYIKNIARKQQFSADWNNKKVSTRSYKRNTKNILEISYLFLLRNKIHESIDCAADPCALSLVSSFTCVYRTSASLAEASWTTHACIILRHETGPDFKLTFVCPPYTFVLYWWLVWLHRPNTAPPLYGLSDVAPIPYTYSQFQIRIKHFIVIVNLNKKYR